MTLCAGTRPLERVATPIPRAGVLAIATADFNRDGSPDLVTESNRGAKVRPGSRDGTFFRSTTPGTELFGIAQVTEWRYARRIVRPRLPSPAAPMYSSIEETGPSFRPSPIHAAERSGYRRLQRRRLNDFATTNHEDAGRVSLFANRGDGKRFRYHARRAGCSWCRTVVRGPRPMIPQCATRRAWSRSYETLEEAISSSATTSTWCHPGMLRRSRFDGDECWIRCRKPYEQRIARLHGPATRLIAGLQRR